MIEPSPTDFPATLRPVLGLLEGDGGGGGASYEDIVLVFDYSGRVSWGKGTSQTDPPPSQYI